MLFLYNLPYVLLTSVIGSFLGGLLAILIVALGLLRFLFLLVLLVTGDKVRFKAEQTEGLSVVLEKGRLIAAKVKSWFNKILG